MKCHQCSKQAVINNPARCKEHFVEGFEKKVWETIERFQLFKPGERIVVAASGGKDSLALAHILSQRYEIDLLCVDEGIAGYRDKTIEDLKKFSSERELNLKIVTFADIGGKSLDELKPQHPCATCGVLRRKALLEYSKDYDVVATGHNLDDEAQSIMMNLLRNQMQLMKRLGPRTSKTAGIAVRVKPFYLTPEREIRAYCILQGITSNFSECPNIVKSFRWKVQEALNELENKQLGSKLSIVEKFLQEHYNPKHTETTKWCKKCGGPSSGDVCNACLLMVDPK